MYQWIKWFFPQFAFNYSQNCPAYPLHTQKNITDMAFASNFYLQNLSEEFFTRRDIQRVTINKRTVGNASVRVRQGAETVQRKSIRKPT
jgi:hypothetical protein